MKYRTTIGILSRDDIVIEGVDFLEYVFKTPYSILQKRGSSTPLIILNNEHMTYLRVNDEVAVPKPADTRDVQKPAKTGADSITIREREND